MAQPASLPQKTAINSNGGHCLLFALAHLEDKKEAEKGRREAIKALTKIAQQAEKNFIPKNNFDALIEKERDDSWKYDGRTVFGTVKPRKSSKGVQLRLF